MAGFTVKILEDRVGTVMVWAQLGTDGQKNIDWIDTDNRLTAKTIDQIDGRHKKINLKPMDQ